MLFSGDFRQILPVIPGSSRVQIVHGCVKSAALYAGFRILGLTENMRLSSLRNGPNVTQTDLQFPNYLLRPEKSVWKQRMIAWWSFLSRWKKVLDIDALCSTVFHGLESNYSDLSLAYFKSYSVHKNPEAHKNKLQSLLKVPRELQDILKCQLSGRRGPKRSSIPCRAS